MVPKNQWYDVSTVKWIFIIIIEGNNANKIWKLEKGKYRLLEKESVLTEVKQEIHTQMNLHSAIGNNY